MDFLILVADFIDKYVMEIAVVVLALLYTVQLIQVKRLKELLSKQ
jgi:K+ transporter